MATKRELILQDLISTLQSITTANGYALNVQNVDRHIEHWEKVAEFPALFVVSGDERIEHKPGLTERANWSVGIVGYVKSEDQKSQEVEKLIGDVKKAVMVDTTRGGNATATTVDEIRDLSVVLSPYGIFEMDLTIIYHYEVSSP